MPGSSHAELLVGYESSDDAAVYRIDGERAIVSTVDFITPPVDDPAWFGRIAAANSLSDIYAMGAKPLFALNLVMYPEKVLGKRVLGEILAGAAEKVKEAGAVLAGGHSVDDREPKFGLCVTGIVDIPLLLRNSGTIAGDAIILTKPLGTGVLFNAVKAGAHSFSRLEEMLPQVARLNGDGLAVLRKHGVRALTDVSGFGLAGHLCEIARSSNVTVKVQSAAIPVYEDAVALYRAGHTTGSNRGNRENVAAEIRVAASSPSEREELWFDPQTSGGLLAALPRESALRAVEELREAGYSGSAIIGEVVSPGIERLIFE